MNTSRPAAIHLWDLVERDRERALIHSYSGLQQSRYVIRSAFGGSEDSFVISGSEGTHISAHNGYLISVGFRFASIRVASSYY